MPLPSISDELRKTVIGMLNAVPNWYRPGGPAPPAEIATGFVELLRRGSEQGPGAR